MEKTRRFAFFVCLVAIFVLTTYNITTYWLRNEAKHKHEPRPLAEGDPSDSANYNIVYVTFPNSQTGEQMAEELVKTNIAPHVKIIQDVTSFYSWNDKLERDSEVLLVIKSRKALLPELTQLVTKHHPYDVPEIISFDVVTTGGCKAQSDRSGYPVE
eukprot:GHVS01003381.1.p1 GENE.GHVS01003381.1~~GHVS01003381.1.p1  ORF type:complete len:157 (+),score=19.86 GHVS01003381.1:58-528(+)